MPLNTLQTDNPIELAHTLSNLLIEGIREKNELGDGPIAARLARLRDAVWPLPGLETTPERRKEIFTEVLDGLDATQKTQLLEAYAHMGHLYDLSALMARENYFANLQKKGEVVPGGIEDFLQNPLNATAADAVGRLNKPVFEVVMTMHPTNINSLDSMQAQRRLAKAIQEATPANDMGKVRKALQEFEQAPVLHERNGKDANFTVRDETNIVLNFLGNIYEDMPRIYRHYDTALTQKFSADYDPTALKLNTRFGSWGSSGDKDGNSSVTAETTLEAIAMHTDAIVSRYAEDLKKISSPALDIWKQRLSSVSSALHDKGLLQEIAQLREDAAKVRSGVAKEPSGEAINKRFDQLSVTLATIRKGLDAKAFEDDLVQVCKQSSGEEKAAALDLVRKVRSFKFHFSKIEYRETAEEYARVTERLVPGYLDMSPMQRVEELTHILTQPGNVPRQLMDKAKQRIIDGGAARSYSAENERPIAWHTLKRMELARDFPDMIKDNVLAECGHMKQEAPSQEVQSQALANILEALLMQRMATSDSGKTPQLGVVPLFEEPGTMEHIAGILETAYANPAYRQHMEQQAGRHDGKLTQQVQIAHSDNARRAGATAARGYIHEAHKKVRKLNARLGIETQFFEGGSISDAYRNGVRAISATVNAFKLQDFAKFTFQGGDLLNYFNVPGSNERVFSRNIIDAANRFSVKKENGDWQLDRRNGSRANGHNGNGTLTNDMMDDIAIAAMKRTLDDYRSEDFTTDRMGVLLAVMDFEGETKAGGRGSRTPLRGDVKPVKHTQELEPVPIDRVRTIGFSEGWQQGGIVPSWLGSRRLGRYLVEETKNKLNDPSSAKSYTAEEHEECKTLLANLPKNGSLSPEQVHAFYKKSPAFRDEVDRSSFAVAMTSPHELRRLKSRLDMHTSGKVLAKARNYFRHTMLDTYNKAGKRDYAALTGRSLDDQSIQPAMSQALYRLTDDITHKTNYREFALFVKDEGGLSDHERGVIHNAGDTVSHGRYLPADDPAYGERRYQDKQAQRRI